MTLLRRVRATASVAIVWGFGGAIVGAARATMLLLQVENQKGWIPPSELIWFMARGWGTTMALAGVAFGATMSAWNQFFRRGKSHWPSIAAGAGAAAIVSVLTVVPRLLAFHVSRSTAVGIAISQALMATAAAIGTIAVAEVSARRRGHSLIRRDKRLAHES